MMNNLDPQLQSVLQSIFQINKLYPVQEAVIPWAQETFQKEIARDLIVAAPTGSGKTLAYVLPLLQFFLRKPIYHPKFLEALIIVPTRDLVKQVYQVIQAFTPFVKVDIHQSTGQMSFMKESQILVQNKRINCQILISTPGRLVDHLEHTPGFCLKHLKFLIVDEVDSLLKHSFREWLPRVFQTGIVSSFYDTNFIANPSQFTVGGENNYQIESQNASKVGSRLHTKYVYKLLFSASINPKSTKLLGLNLFRPSFIQVRSEKKNVSIPPLSPSAPPTPESPSSPSSPSPPPTQQAHNPQNTKFFLAPTLKEYFVFAPESQRFLSLVFLLESKKVDSAFIFVNSVDLVTKLSYLINKWFQDDTTCAPYHAQLDPQLRKRLLQKVVNGEISFLVTTDVLSRGLDIQSKIGVKKKLPDVINYGPTPNSKTYLHRAGRTARANNKGSCWTLIDPSQVKKFFKTIRPLGRTAKQSFHKVEFEESQYLKHSSWIAENLENFKDEAQDTLIKQKSARSKRFRNVSNITSESQRRNR